MSESCNSRHFSWLMKSCFPNQNHKSLIITPQQLNPSLPLTISSLPDDLLLECLSRVPASSLPSLSVVCRRWFYLILSPSFLILRQQLRLIYPSLFAFSATDSGVFAATLSFSLPNHCLAAAWDLSLCLPMNTASLQSVSRLVSIGPRIYMIGRDSMLRYNTWTQHVNAKSPMLFSRKKFAAAVISNKIYVAGGSRAASAVEEYDPESDTWRVVTYSQRRRYGCVGAAVDGVFYVIGGLKIGGACADGVGRIEAHVYASSMDLYDVEARVWLRSRAVPGGGCVVAACAVAGYVYVLTSHAVELSFWRFDARRKSSFGGGVGEGFGEWCRMKSPPMPTQIRLDGTVRFCCVGVGDNKVIFVQVAGCIDDLLRRSGRSERGFKDGLVLVYDSVVGDWSRAPDLPELLRRAACVSVAC